MNYIRLLTDQLIEHKQEAVNSPKFSEQERRITESVQKILQEHTGTDKPDDLISLREVLHLLAKDQISELDAKLIAISQKLPKPENSIYNSIIGEGWENYWKEYNEFIDLFPKEQQDESLFHAANVQLSSLQTKSKKILKSIISDHRLTDKKKFFDICGSSFFLDHKDNSEDIDRLLSAIEKIHPDDRANVVELATSLPLKNMSCDQKILVLTAIRNIDGNREKFIEQAKELFTGKTNTDVRIVVSLAIVEIARRSRSDVTERAQQLFIGRTSDKEKAAISMAIAKITEEERSDVIERARPLFAREGNRLLFTQEAIDSEKAAILAAVANIDKDDRENVITHARSLFVDGMLEGMKGEEKAAILAAVANIDKDDRENTITHARSLFAEGMNGGEKAAILVAIGKIPKDDRENVIGHARLLFAEKAVRLQFATREMMNNEKAATLTAIAQIPKDDRENVIGHARLLFAHRMNGEEKAAILAVIAGIDKDDRGPLIEQAKPLLVGTTRGNEKVILLTAIARIPKDDRENVIRHAGPFVVELKKGEEGAAILAAITRIAKNERESLIRQARSLGIEQMNGNNKARILDVFRIIPLEKREDFAEEFKSLEFVITKLCNGDYFFAIMALYVLPADLKTRGKLLTLKDKLLNYPEYQKAIVRSLGEKLSNTALPLSALLGAADFVTGYYHELRLREDHPLVQQAMEVMSAASVEDKKNPISLYKKLKELELIPEDFTPPKYTIDESITSINMDGFRGISRQTIKREELPKEATVEAWDQLIYSLRAKMEGAPGRHGLPKKKVKVDDEELEVIAPLWDTFGITWTSLWQQSLQDNYLRNLLLPSDDERISSTEAKFRAIVSRILAEDNSPREGHAFTAREEVLITIAMSIQFCPAGKGEGIDGAYRDLEPTFRYQVALPEGSRKEEETVRAMEFVTAVVKNFVARQFDGNTALMRELMGVEEGKGIRQVTHQATYLKNLIGPLVGLDHKLTYDQHTGILYDSLIAKTRKEVLEIFFKHVTPGSMIKEVMRAVNSNLDESSPIILPLITDGECWDASEAQDDLSMTLNTKGTFKLLQEAGYLTNRDLR